MLCILTKNNSRRVLHCIFFVHISPTHQSLRIIGINALVLSSLEIGNIICMSSSEKLYKIMKDPIEWYGNML